MRSLTLSEAIRLTDTDHQAVDLFLDSQKVVHILETKGVFRFRFYSEELKTAARALERLGHVAQCMKTRDVYATYELMVAAERAYDSKVAAALSEAQVS